MCQVSKPIRLSFVAGMQEGELSALSHRVPDMQDSWHLEVRYTLSNPTPETLPVGGEVHFPYHYMWDIRLSHDQSILNMYPSY